MDKQLHALDIVVHTVTGEEKQLTKFSITYPSDGAPDVETLLSLVIQHVNDECGTRFVVTDWETLESKL